MYCISGMQEEWAKHLKPKNKGVFEMIKNKFKKNNKPEKAEDDKQLAKQDKGSLETDNTKKALPRRLVSFFRNRAVLALLSLGMGSALTSIGLPALAPYFTPENISLLLLFVDVLLQSEPVACVGELCK